MKPDHQRGAGRRPPQIPSGARPRDLATILWLIEVSAGGWAWRLDEGDEPAALSVRHPDAEAARKAALRLLHPDVVAAAVQVEAPLPVRLGVVREMEAT